MWLLFRLFFLILLTPVCVLATDYYFAADGNDNNPCTIGEPCASLSSVRHHLSRAQPGDTFHLRGGDIFDGEFEPCIAASNVDGAPDQPITFTSYGTGRAILENCDSHAIKANRSDWWVVEHLEIRNSSYGIRCDGCQDWVFQHNSMHDLSFACFSFDSFPRETVTGIPSARWVVQHNLCYETGVLGHGEGVYIYPGPTEDLLFENNEFYQLRDEGINCKGNNRHIVVRQNYFHDFHPHEPRDAKNKSLFSQFASWVGQWFVKPATAGQNPSEDTAIHCRFDNDEDVLVERNIIANMPYNGIMFKRLQQAVIQHNLVIGSGVTGIVYTDGVTGRIDYNVIYDNRRSSYSKPPEVSVENDITWLNGRGNNPTDPQFVDVPGGDFNLAATSDRRDAGSDGLSKGVFHSPAFNACSIREGARNTVRCSVHEIRFSPLRCPSPEAFTVSVNGVSRGPATECQVSSDRVIHITFPGEPITAGDRVRLNAGYGALQDSAWIGGRTPEGECLAGLFTCNSMSLALENRHVNNRLN